MEIIFWILNGLLAVIYTAAGNAQAIGVAASALPFAFATTGEQRAWAVFSACLALLAALLAPAPAPTFLMLMSLGGWAAFHIEQYNRTALRWSVIRGQFMYALASLGLAGYHALGLDAAIHSDPLMMQGASYLNALIGITMYVLPIGFLAWLTQSIWAHPPAPAAPEQIINTVRTRKRD